MNHGRCHSIQVYPSSAGAPETLMNGASNRCRGIGGLDTEEPRAAGPRTTVSKKGVPGSVRNEGTSPHTDIVIEKDIARRYIPAVRIRAYRASPTEYSESISDV